MKTINRDAMKTALAALGLDPSQLVKVTIAPDVVVAESPTGTTHFKVIDGPAVDTPEPVSFTISASTMGDLEANCTRCHGTIGVQALDSTITSDELRAGLDAHRCPA